MKLYTLLFFLNICSASLSFSQEKIKIEYCRQNVDLEVSDRIEYIDNVSGNHHLLNFAKEEKPLLFIFNRQLELQQKIILPFVLPERADIRIIPFAHYYFIAVHSWYTAKNMVWRVDGEGNSIDLSAAFATLLRQQHLEPTNAYQLMATDRGLVLWYHTDEDNIEKNTLVMLRADSMLRPVSISKVMYDFKRDEEMLRQELILSGKYLLVVKTARSSSALELVKVNLSTGALVKNTFYSSGFLYSQPMVHYNPNDSGITVTAMLSDVGNYSSRWYVFMCRLNSELAEEKPVTILKKQFAKGTSTNFLEVDGYSSWVRFRSGFRLADNANLGNISLYQDYITPDSNRILSTIRPVTTTMERLSNWNEQDPGVRFSLLDTGFHIINEKRVANTRDAYTIRPEQYTRFALQGKEYLLVGQRFRRKWNGLLMVAAGKDKQLDYTDIRVFERNEYILSGAKVTSPNSIIIPYLHKHEAGLVKITIE